MFFTLPTYAQKGANDIIKQLKECHAKTDQVERLNCYDGFTISLPDPEPETSLTLTSIGDNLYRVGNWTIQDKTNPIDDSRQVTSFIVSSEGQSSYGEPISLLIRCMSGKTELFINWADYLGRSAYITTRIGDNEAESAAWNLSSDKQAAFLPKKQVEFIRSLMGANKFVARVTPYNESPITAVFELDGITEAVGPVREACNW